MKKLLHKVEMLCYKIHMQPKLIASHLLLVIIPTIVITYFLYGQLHNIIVSYTVRQEQAMSIQTRDSLNTLIQQIENFSNTVVKNSYLQDLFASHTKEKLIDQINSEQTAAFFYTMNSLIESNIITDIKIYADIPVRQLYSGSDSSVFLPLKDAKGTYWNGIFESSQTSTLYCPSFYLSPNELKNYGEMALIKKENYSMENKTNTAYIVIYFAQEQLNRILHQTTSENNTVTYILNERDALIASSNPSVVATYLMNYQEVLDSFLYSPEYITKTVLGESVYAGFYAITDTNWYMVSILPANRLLQKGNLLIWQFLGFYLLFLGIAFIMANWVSRSLTQRISSVIKQMASIRNGPPAPMENTPFQDEIGELVVTYNYMSNQINQLLEDQAKSAEHLRLAEFEALQSQINPHFLYNTLDMINWLAKTQQTAKVTDSVQALSKFYKLTLNRGNISVRIEEELTHASLYVQLQNMRYQDKIHLFVDVPDELLDYTIPKIVLQPIVENAISHGIFEKEKKEGTIVITGWREDDELVLLVSDDGIGIPPDKIGEILTGKGSSSTGSNVGIYNTHIRLQLFYNNSHLGLSYRSTLGTGTDVEIRIAAQKKE